MTRERMYHRIGNGVLTFILVAVAATAVLEMLFDEPLKQTLKGIAGEFGLALMVGAGLFFMLMGLLPYCFGGWGK